MSVDSPYSHRAWAQQLTIPYPMVSDFGRELIRAYGVPEHNMRLLPGTSGRSAFLIGAEGVLRHVWYQADSPGLPPVGQILEAARALLGPAPVEEG